MKLTRKIVSGVIYATLLLASTNAPALTLGKLRGAALLGKELDVTVTVQFAADEDIAAICFAADVSFGDTPVEANRLTVRSRAGSQPNTQIVQIASSARVEDAVVTINLKTSCGSKASRRYVLLSDVLSELALVAPSTQAVSVGTSVEATPAREDGASSGDLPTAPLAVAVSSKSGKARTKSAIPVAPVGQLTGQKQVVESALKLAPVVSEHAVSGKVASQANAVALDELQHRVESIEKWQAQSTTADDLLRNQDRTKTWEADINGLKAITAKNQKNLQTVAAAMDGAQSQSYGRSLVYALAALLAACLAAVAYAVNRLRSGVSGDSAPWWFGGDNRTEAKPVERAAVVEEALPAPDLSPPVALPTSVLDPVQASSAGEVTSQATMPVAAVSASSVADVEVDIDIEGTQAQSVAPTVFNPLAQPTAPTGQTDFVNSVQVPTRALNTQEMLDIRQQAEFFMALGQHDDAVKLLANSIQDSDDANPLVFLDLLKIFHTLSRREDFERYREDFNRHFTGRIPPYADFLMEGNGLDAYEDICQQIVVLWPTEYTIDFIEQCLVRMPEDDPEQGIDLDAFKDLLLLYGILKRLDQTVDSVMLPFSTSRTANSQFEGLQATGEAKAARPTVKAAKPLHALSAEVDETPAAIGLDLDLDISLGIEEPAAPEHGNLIDFDVSGFIKPEPGKNPK